MAEINAKNTLHSQDAHPKKRLGQNFLTDKNIIIKVINAAILTPADTVLEIGPGTGNLTAFLAKTAKIVVAVEFDRNMVDILSGSFKNTDNVRIVSGDILKFDETSIKAPYKIVANLPFYLTAPAIRKFLESSNPPNDLTLIVQKEVAQRICSAPPKMSILALSVQFYAKAKIAGYISRSCFWPAPNVDSAIIKITPHINKPDANLAAAFFLVVKAGFSHPRKQLINNLTKKLAGYKPRGREETKAWLAESNVNPNQRAETLTIDQWINLAKTYSTKP